MRAGYWRGRETHIPARSTALVSRALCQRQQVELVWSCRLLGPETLLVHLGSATNSDGSHPILPRFPTPHLGVPSLLGLFAGCCLSCPDSRGLGGGARATGMTSVEPRPIDSFCPKPGPSEWGSGGGGGSSSGDKDVVPEKGVGGG